MAKRPGSNLTLAAAWCRRLGPGTATRTIARGMFAKFPERFANLEAARKAVLAVRGRNGKNSSAKVAPENRVHRPPQKSGWKPACPKSIDEGWVPLQIEGPARVLSLSDIHSPFHCKRAVETAVKHGKSLRPTHVVLLGDIMDFFNLSRFDKDPSRVKTANEFEIASFLLSWLRSEFPKARIIYKQGNHEERWRTYIWNHAPALWGCKNMELANALDLDEYGIELVGDIPIMAGKLPMLHGHELGKSGSPVNAARGAFMKANHTLLVGHSHKSSTHPESDIFGKEIMTWSQGCLCGLTPQWWRVNKWNHGFSFIDVARDNEFDMRNLRISKDFKVRTA